jgi:c-di-GMP-related signal transduction protein
MKLLSNHYIDVQINPFKKYRAAFNTSAKLIIGGNKKTLPPNKRIIVN